MSPSGFRERGIPYSDLLQEGFCGLLEAIDRFDMTHETKLATLRHMVDSPVDAAGGCLGCLFRSASHLATSANWLRIRCPISITNPGEAIREPPRRESPKSDLIDRIHTGHQPTVSLDAQYDCGSDSVSA